jgi:hypothetical protein
MLTQSSGSGFLARVFGRSGEVALLALGGVLRLRHPTKANVQRARRNKNRDKNTLSARWQTAPNKRAHRLTGY